MKRIFDWVWNTSAHDEHEEDDASDDGQENAMLQPTANDHVAQTPTPPANVPRQRPKRPRFDAAYGFKVLPVNGLNRGSGGKLYTVTLNGQSIISASHPCYVRCKYEANEKWTIWLQLPNAFAHESDHLLSRIEKSLAPCRFDPEPIRPNVEFTDHLIDFPYELSTRVLINRTTLYSPKSRIVDHTHGLPIDFDDILPGLASVSLRIGHVVHLHDSSLRLQWIVSELKCNNIHRARADFAMALVRKQGIDIPPLVTERIIYFLLVK